MDEYFTMKVTEKYREIFTEKFSHRGALKYLHEKSVIVSGVHNFMRLLNNICEPL
jgi:hypothetical protein